MANSPQRILPYRRFRQCANLYVMTKSSRDVWLAGVDGCKGGWLAVLVRPNGADVRVLDVFRNFSDLLTGPDAPAIIAVDIPIGLPRESELRGRGPERVVRQQIRPRSSSVFRIPSRRAVYAGIDERIPDDSERYAHAREIARSTSIDKKAFAKQGFYLFPKIVQVDKLLRQRKELIGRVFETHPEVAFWRLNDEQGVSSPKHQKAGLKIRRELLMKARLPKIVVDCDPPKGAKPDDLLDALACAVVARRIYDRTAKHFPDQPSLDEYDLPMAIWA